MVFKVVDLEQSFPLMMDYLLSQDQQKNIYLLKGDLGSGKTTFVKEFVQYLGGEGVHVDSPTFSIVNTYDFTGKIIHHFDLYRLESLEEIEDIGFMEYIDSGNTCFIEWPEKIAEFLPIERVVHIGITVSLNECREYSFS
ncbi:MAG: tRNA (adenosine(37)-N6)-threonylcarbamoyltransferase complex ATPase subunit type 1 TsaE [Bacteroidetes bacterium]|nr:MAG: tRNA (adenosine(37)-N6)-threonylcarbamoyltransferase complex ATPase subunit type 1 TsaE [Bacteroidota bacterium]